MAQPRFSNYDVIMPVACRSIIASGYEMLFVCFSVLSGELSTESGEMDLAGRSGVKKKFFVQQIERLYSQLLALYTGKLSMHDALNGGTMDTDLLGRLGRHIAEVERDLIRPLQVSCQEQLPTDIRRSHELGEKLAGILERAKPDRELADQRFAEKLEIATPPEKDNYSVICIDMKEYSDAARVAEAMDDATSVYRLNLAIKNRVRTAIDKAIERAVGRPSDSFPINDRGDGVVIYVPRSPGTDPGIAPGIAVKIAMNFQKDSMTRQLKVESLPTPPWKFRIGIASGGVCLSMVYSPAYKLIEFGAGGTPIINAARLEHDCPENCVLIDEETYALLPVDLKPEFLEYAGALLKEHEGAKTDGTPKVIKAWIWKQCGG